MFPPTSPFSSLLKPHFIQTQSAKGLTLRHAEKVIEILNKPDFRFRTFVGACYDLKNQTKTETWWQALDSNISDIATASSRQTRPSPNSRRRSSKNCSIQ